MLLKGIRGLENQYMKLYSYCLRFDGGAAPNPYWGTCTLAICKPAIRRTVEIKDWIVGLGSVNSPIGDISEYMVYAMKVTDKMTLKNYDAFCARQLPKKIPNWRSRDYRIRMGDCLYDYSSGPIPELRQGVHLEANRKRDLSGEYALVSKHYYYFGDHPVKLPPDLQPIVHATQGYKSDSNEPYVEAFVTWIEGLGYRPNKLHGNPQLLDEYSRDSDVQSRCSTRSLEEEAILFNCHSEYGAKGEL